MSSYITEAFKQLDLLNEDAFDIDTQGIEDLKELTSDEPAIDIIDAKAEDELDLEDSYVGKVVLDCCVCHSKIYKDADSVVISDDGEIANEGDECPYCYSVDGYKVIGQIAPFKEDSELKVEVEDKDGDGEIEEDEVEVEEKSKDESLNQRPKKNLQEKWATRITAGADLRRAINDSDYQGILDGIKACYQEMLDKGVIDDWDFERWVEDLDYLDPEDEDIEDSLDYELNNLYDACDNLDCWIELDESLKKRGVKENFEKVELETEDSVIKVAEEEKEEDFSDLDFTDFSSIDFGDEEPVDEESEEVSEEEEETFGESLKKNSEGLQENKTEATEAGPVKEDFERVELETEDKVIKVSEEEKEEIPDAEMIEPLDTEAKTDIIQATKEEAPEEEGEFVDQDFDEFSEEEFDDLGESYLKKVYGNVESFKTTKVSTKGNTLKLEGVIKFTSGNSKPTTFLFESKDITKKGKMRFIGENCQISRGKKSFTLTGRAEGKKFIAESLNYNYMAKGADGKSTRLYGTVKKSLHEANLSNIEGTAGHAMSQKDVMNKLSNCASPEEVKALADTVIPAERKNEPKIKKLLLNLNTAKNLAKAQSIFTNFILKGEGLGVIN